MAYTTPTTLLEATNAVLAGIGELPVNSIPDSGLSEAVLAKDTVLEVSREIQALGLHCNTDIRYKLTPDTQGFITVPTNVLKIDAHYRDEDYVIRGSRLYDRTNQTFIFTKPVEVDIVWLLDFEELPEVVRRYVTIRAARLFQKRVVGSEGLHGLSEEDEQRAYAAVMQEEILTEDANFLEGPLVSQGTLLRGSVFGW
jgi:hypothetical protein